MLKFSRGMLWNQQVSEIIYYQNRNYMGGYIETYDIEQLKKSIMYILSKSTKE